MQRAEETTIPEINRWYFGAAERWPQVFSDRGIIAGYQQAAQLIEEGPDAEWKEKFVAHLRASLLKIVHKETDNCTRCDLSANRLPLRPVLDDSSYDNDPFRVLNNNVVKPVGAVTAKIMMIAEGPGQFEQRTGQPQVSYTILAGSFCAQFCTNYELCYPQGARIPARNVCDYTPLEDRVEEIRNERANARPWRLHTAGQVLDDCILGANLWRESWNSRLLRKENRRMDPKPGTLYMTNLVRCRACQPSKEHPLGTIDQAPNTEQIGACDVWMSIQRYIIQPNVIVSVGAVATAAILGLDKVKITSPEILENTHLGPEGIPVVATVHPSYILRQTQQPEADRLAEGLIAGLLRAQDISANGGPEPAVGRLPLVADLPQHLVLPEHFNAPPAEEGTNG